jgi:hypothetical protein
MNEEDTVQPTNPNEKLSGVEVRNATSLLQQVREGLKTDKRVFFAGEILYSPYGAGWLEGVNIIVAPIKPIYDSNKLNDFMESLTPDIKRSAQDEATKYNKESDFSLGKLYFDEVLGEIKKEVDIVTTAIESDALRRAGITIGKSHQLEREVLKRRTWVRVYPDAFSAQMIAEYEQGVKDGTIEYNQDFESMEYRFNSKQIDELKKNNNKPSRIFPKLTEKQK